MKYVVSFLAALFLSAVSLAETAKMPDEFYKLPEAIQKQATFIVSGIYEEDMYPFHTIEPDGSHEWFQRQGFWVKNSYKGNRGRKSKKAYVAIGLELPHEKYLPHYFDLKKGWLYLILLRPEQESIKAIKNGGSALSHEYVLKDEEILAIVDLGIDASDTGEATPQ